MRPLVATIDLAAIVHNYRLARRCAPGRQAFAVVKANAYGHGAREVVSVLHDEADGFAVASLEEAAEVRAMHAEARILLLEGCFSADELPMAAHLGLDLVLQGPEQVEVLLAADLPRPLNVWLKLDSGMHRLGFSAEAIRELFPRLRGAAQVAELNLISHFACADERGHSMTELQLERFLELLDLDFDQRSLANSAAVVAIPAAHMDWLRPGIMLYGATPLVDLSAAELGLKPAMTLGAQLIAVRQVPAGENIGYGADWVAARPSRIGTVSCGYADGYPRQAPAGTPVWIGGRRVPLAGRVSMDMLMVDLTDLPEAAVGDAVELWGANLPVDEVARAAGTIGYELLTKVTARVPRRYHT
ncbi:MULTISPECIES: alanine racemase [unclassified Pseudomonas]|uniref:alanine racemase n=1 Tax=unclassified Pseudomonas TaxID=196821 RepID=UPI002447209F|nr:MULTISPECIES: alanine racemase [unclassified Pseudomonas]MDG9926794.1 alanine racemase [Pseudomonas sp. GD04042]MDH0482137.1 alanine racemase [Pseudomonas sp. GD04015]MDH0603573.1 alanine racemase [Pseudomonas sp. GD03869]